MFRYKIIETLDDGGMGLVVRLAGPLVNQSRRQISRRGHKSLTMVRRYIREGSLFRENAATKLGL